MYAALLFASLLATPAPGSLQLDAPADRTVVRGNPVELPLRLAPGQAHATGLRVEIDGQPRGYLLPWTTSVTLEPGLHRVRVHGYDARDGQPLSSPSVQVAVFDEADRAPLDPRARNGWTALIALVLAVASAAALRRRGEL